MKKAMWTVVGITLALLAVWCAFQGRLILQRRSVERSYVAAGYTMQLGCNASWANQATINLWSLSNELEQVQQSPVPDTNELIRIQQNIVAAQKEVAFREEDCRKRGHADTIPVKPLTNAPAAVHQ
jgi:hypothetical protein